MTKGCVNMFLQKHSYKISGWISIGSLFLYLLFLYLNSYVYKTVAFEIIAQVSISIFASALVVCIIAYISFKNYQDNFIHNIAIEMKLLYNYVDEYIQIKEIEKVYFESFYRFRDYILSMNTLLSTEMLDNKDSFPIITHYAEVYSNLRLMLYYSVFAVKNLELAYNQEHNILIATSEMNSDTIRESLDKILKPIHDVLNDLNSNNSLNFWASQLQKSIGIEIHVNNEKQDKQYASPEFWFQLSEDTKKENS